MAGALKLSRYSDLGYPCAWSRRVPRGARLGWAEAVEKAVDYSLVDSELIIGLPIL